MGKIEELMGHIAMQGERETQLERESHSKNIELDILKEQLKMLKRARGRVS